MATKNKNTQDQLRWRFDVNAFRLFGRELITDRITAVFELVKNCYDANATQVTVDFHNVTNKASDSKITISDNGTGMSFLDIKDKWMVVGTNSKRTQLYSNPPFNRKFVGEKGIGRFAVDKLGERLHIKTKTSSDKDWLNVNINWDEYEKLATSSSSSSQLSLFTEVDNDYSFETAKQADEHGTTLTITQVSEEWTEEDIERLYKELSKLVSPFYPVNPPFNITINSNEFKGYENKPIKSDPIKYFSHKGEITYSDDKQKQQVLRFDQKEGKIYTEWTDVKSFGPIRLKMFFFNDSAKRKYKAAYKSDDTRIDGIKIYRDGVVTTPFAEYEAHPDRKRDILGIDKRLWRDIFFRISTREIIGVVDITKENNPKIIDATNRQDFVDNREYRDLKEFIIEQLDVFSEVKKFQNESKRSDTEKELQKAGQEVKNFTDVIAQLEQEISDRPELKEVLDPLKEKARDLKTAISQSINEQKKFQREVLRKENIYHSLMSLQDYASNISHAIRTSLGKIKRQAEFFKNNFPNPKYASLFKQYAIIINDEMDVLIQVTDFMLSYASSDLNFEEFNVKQVLEKLLLDTYKETFTAEKIKAVVEISDDFIINANKKFFEDIFLNLVSNSIKALKNTTNKTIKCTGYLDADHFTLYFSDNGYGINKGDEKWIFGIYNTRTAEAGGAGLGLYIVDKRIEALKGTIEVIENEFKPTGATFKITLPFNKA